MTPIPFKTDDAILASCLYSAGVPESWNPTNIYDEGILKKLGLGGMILWEAAKTAFKRKYRGHIEYYFERTPELAFLLKAYRDQEAIIKAEGENKDIGEAIREIMRVAAGRLNDGETVMDEREAILRITCIVLKTRTDFVNRWKNEVPYLRIAAAGSVEKPSLNVERHPGFKMIPLTASDETIQKMNL